MTQDELKLLIEDLISMMEYHVEQTRPIHTTTVALQAAKEALKALAQPEQEPVIDKSAAIRIATALGWTPPRPWVGLTDEEIDDIYFQHQNPAEHQVAIWPYERAIEAKLKERNI